MTEYKKYSLGQVENFLYDAMSTDATPQEIYDVIKSVVQDNYYTYKAQTAKASELLELLNGHRPIDLDYDEWESDVSSMPLVEPKDKVVKWSLPVEADPSGEYFVTFPDDLLEAADLKEGDQMEWIDQGDGSYMLQKIK